MGWRGTLRSVNAAMKRAEREAQRRHKQAVNDAMVANAAEAVEDWADHIRSLITIHTNLADGINWHAIERYAAPIKPKPSTMHREKLAPAMRNFEPRFRDKFLGGTEKRKQKLIAAFHEAKARDAADSQRAMAEYQTAYADWQSDNKMARDLIAGNPEALKEVVSEMQSLSDDGLIGSNIEFRFGHGIVHAIPQVHTDEVVPSFRRKQLASGRLSETKMPVGDFNELYQDYVASVALRVAGDLFQLLPINEVYVTCQTSMLNTQTGHLSPTPVLSVKFVRATFVQLNLSSIDPSDSLRNFVHHMDFKRSKGFAPIEPLETANVLQ